MGFVFLIMLNVDFIKIRIFVCLIFVFKREKKKKVFYLYKIWSDVIVSLNVMLIWLMWRCLDLVVRLYLLI